MDVVDARSGQLVRHGQTVRYPGGEDDWTLLDVRFRSLLSRTVIVRRADGDVVRIAAPVKLFPQTLYGPHFPSRAFAVVVFPS